MPFKPLKHGTVLGGQRFWVWFDPAKRLALIYIPQSGGTSPFPGVPIGSRMIFWRFIESVGSLEGEEGAGYPSLQRG